MTSIRMSKNLMLVFLLLLILLVKNGTAVTLDEQLLEVVEGEDEPNVTMIHSLLEQGANAGFTDRRQKTPLYLACSLDRDEIAQLLISKATNETINQPDLHGMTPLHWASAFNRVDTLQELMQGGARVNAVSHRWNTTALHLAAMNGQTDAVQVLLDHGALVEAVDIQGQTPLWLACQYGHLDTAMLLLENGADVFRGDRDGVSPFAIANLEENHRLVQYLNERFPSAYAKTCLYKLQQWPFSCLFKTRIQFGIQWNHRMGINAPMAIGYS